MLTSQQRDPAASSQSVRASAPPPGRRRWPTVGQYIAAEHTRLTTEDPDADWLPRALEPKDFQLALPRYERTPYRVWSAIEQRARAVPWSRIAATLGVPEPTLRSWIRHHATPAQRPSRRRRTITIHSAGTRNTARENERPATMTGTLDLHVVTANLKRAGYDYGTRHHDHTLLRQLLSTLEYPPHVLFLSECTFYDARTYLSTPLFDALDVLDSLWGTTIDAHGRAVPAVQYTPFLSTVAGSINSPGLFIDRRYVRPRCWYPADWRHVLANSLVADINGHEILLKCVHWNGSGGHTGFDRMSSQHGQLAQRKAILAGDFNATSSHPGEHLPQDWHELCVSQGNAHKLSQKGIRQPDGTWRLNTQALDAFLEHGWWDAGEAAGDFTPTVRPAIDGGSGLRIDRITVSNRTPATLVSGSYTVHVPDGPAVSDHRMVSCWLRIDPPPTAAAPNGATPR
ncbi:endonuclease/exonuclease/phosphatase family protein [Amycolatopsis sp. lyj-23]|uniref:endonuclease/exonuclease/phosphatase family protein n=1 Tax=Amycolatopsis sp. lyj-23 TaxID=2789283 RepID=UPI00397C194D